MKYTYTLFSGVKNYIRYLAQFCFSKSTFTTWLIAQTGVSDEGGQKLENIYRNYSAEITWRFYFIILATLISAYLLQFAYLSSPLLAGIAIALTVIILSSINGIITFLLTLIMLTVKPATLDLSIAIWLSFIIGYTLLALLITTFKKKAKDKHYSPDVGFFSFCPKTMLVCQTIILVATIIPISFNIYGLPYRTMFKTTFINYSPFIPYVAASIIMKMIIDKENKQYLAVDREKGDENKHNLKALFISAVILTTSAFIASFIIDLIQSRDLISSLVYTSVPAIVLLISVLILPSFWCYVLGMRIVKGSC